MNTKYTIISDCSCDLLPADLAREGLDFVVVPLTYTLDGAEYTLDENHDTHDLLARMKQSKHAPKTACPSPERFAEDMRASKNDHIFVLTIGSKISGTYASACMGAEIVRAEPEHANKKIFVLDSQSTSSGLARLLYKLVGYIESGKYDYDGLTRKITTARLTNRIRFILNDIGNLVKSGRVSKVIGIITSIIPIKLILGDNGDGEIKKHKQVIGFKKGLDTLANYPGETLATEGTGNQIVISHCNNEEGASFLKRLLESRFGFNNIKTLFMRGIAAVFANDKGILLAY
jgi:DegV family protein with EDD domain